MRQPVLSSSSSGSDLKEDASNAREQPASGTRTRGRFIYQDSNDIPDDDKITITAEQCQGKLGYGFSTTKKWMIVTVIFIIQISMNINTSLYSNAVNGITERFNVSAQAARVGSAAFLVAYAFGCELFAPWSEELGRKPVLQLSLFLVNIFQLPVALATNFSSVIIGRTFCGLCSAGGSVTLGIVADMFDAHDQQFAVACVVFSSVGGSVVGPVVGGYAETYLGWRWAIWIQLIFGGVVQALHLFFVPETRITIMMDNIAKQRRKADPGLNLWGPNEMIPFRQRFAVKELCLTMLRPFKMFVTEPIVLSLSLLSGFSDALIFMFIESFALVYSQWGFDRIQTGWTFMALLVGYGLAWALFIPAIRRNIHEREQKPDCEKAQYESRLWLLLFLAPMLPIGMFGFAWTATGPPLHFAGTLVFVVLVGIANYAIYMATIDYMVAAYGPYAASATGGNGWARDFLAGVLTVPATPFFQNIDSKPIAYASTILACISLVLVMAVYVTYFCGPSLRARSSFAQSLSHEEPVEKNRTVARTEPYV